MNDFPEFMKSAANKIATSSQETPGVEGYVFDGADGSQMAFWTCHESAVSGAHVHDFDEYMIVVQGCYTLIVDGKRIPVKVEKNILFRKDYGMVVRLLREHGPFMCLVDDGRKG
jgi:quercetin dioxygenase-like cupin family protein